MFPAQFNLVDLNGKNGFALNGIHGDVGDESGYSISEAGDVNADGIADIIIGVPHALNFVGQSYVVFGSNTTFPAQFDLTSLNGTNGFILNGINSGQDDDQDGLSGASVSGAGDVNGDGIADIIIGAKGALDGAGQSYVVFGNNAGFPAEFNLVDLNGINGFALNGINGGGYGDFSGSSVSRAGDVNADGIDDIIIGAPGALNYYGESAGQSYVVFGSNTTFPAQFDLSSLNGQNGFMVNGINQGDQSGWSVSGAGDVNGDSYGDFIIWAPLALSAAGQSYVVYGSKVEFSSPFELSSLNGTNGFTINGIYEDSSLSGYSVVSGAGDFSGDGIDDVIIGAPGGNVNGQSYVVFGSNDSFTAQFNLTSLNGTNGFALIGYQGGSGSAVSAAGDVNGDGIADIIIGAPKALYFAGQSYVVFGSKEAFPAQFDLSLLNGKNGFALNGINDGMADESGYSVGSAGDFNGDGLSDIIIGAPDALNDAGQSYVVFGNNEPYPTPSPSALPPSPSVTPTAEPSQMPEPSVSPSALPPSPSVTSTPEPSIAPTLDPSVSATPEPNPSSGPLPPFPAQFDLSSLNGKNGFALNGFMFSNSGWSVSGAGDINGDGIADIIIGAPGALNTDGQSYVVFGNKYGFPVQFDLSSLNGRNGFAIDGIDQGDGSGNSVSGAGDINGDGIADIIIGAPGALNTDEQSYVIFGSKDGFPAQFNLTNLNGNNGFALDGGGYSVGGAGDFNGDGIGDVIVGGGSLKNYAGQSYIVFGNSTGFPAQFNLTSLNGQNGFALNGTGYYEESGGSVSGAGDFNGDGIDDVIINALGWGGSSFVVFGSKNEFPAQFSLGSLNGKNGFALISPFSSGVGAAASVSGAGDVNGDGVDDVIISVSADTGHGYVVFGSKGSFPAFIELSSLNGKNGFALNGFNITEFIGASVSGAGDINGDGVDDVIIGVADELCKEAPSDDEASTVGCKGQSYVVFGSKTGFPAAFNLTNLDGQNGFMLNGFYSRDGVGSLSGYSVSGAGDFNGDGTDDVIIGAPYVSYNGAYAGQSYIVYGRSYSPVIPSASPSPGSSSSPSPGSSTSPSPGSEPSSGPHASSSPGSNNSPTGGSGDIGPIIGGAVGGVVVIGAIAALVWYGNSHGWCAGARDLGGGYVELEEGV